MGRVSEGHPVHGVWSMVVVVTTALLGGCYLPLGTAAPQPATTVGQGNLGASFHAEVPVVDLLATQTEDGGGSDYELSPFPTASLEVAFGLGDRLDLEVGLDGTLYFWLLPMPLGASAGLRGMVRETDALAFALAGRVGYVGLGVEDEVERTGEDLAVSALYGKVTGAAQLNPRGAFRPGLALSILPAQVRNDALDDAERRFGAMSASATVHATIAVRGVHIGPFVNFVYFDSPNLRGSEGFVSGGIFLALRPEGGRVAATTPPATSGWE